MRAFGSIVAVVVVAVILGVAGVAYVGWRAFRELGLGPWASAGATLAAMVILGAIGDSASKRVRGERWSDWDEEDRP